MTDNLKYLVVEVTCQSCSFRNPEFQNFHKTFELPPPTTVIGLGGAALGLSPKQTQDFFEEGFEFGIYGSHKGKANDLWKYRKLKSGAFISDILTREVLFENHYNLVYGTSHTEKINKLMSAFENPKYALTLGNSDSLAKIVSLQFIDKTIECDELENCVVAGNLMKEVLDNTEKLEFSLRDGVDPISYDVPVEFEYERDYGVRKVLSRKEFSFIGPKLYVKGLKKKGIQYKNHQIPIFELYA